MPARVKRLVRSFAALSLVGAISAFAANDARADDFDPNDFESNEENARSRWSDWIPAMALSGSFYGQGHDSALESSCDGGGFKNGVLAACTQGRVQEGEDPRNHPPELAAAPAQLRPAEDGSDFPLWPGVGVELQVMSPVVVDLPFEVKPRIFISGELTAAFPPERTIATEGSLDVLKEPDTGQPSTSIPTQALEGAGSHTESIPQTLHYGVQAGIAIPVQFRGRTINIKPSFGWSQWKLDVTGRVLAGVKDDVNGTPGNIAPFGENTREIFLKSSETLTVNGIGPGIEVEYISGRFGDVAAAVFIGANAYKVIGDRKLKLDNAVTFPGGPGNTVGADGLLEDTYRAHWEHEIDPWFYRLRLGIRFHYMRD